LHERHLSASGFFSAAPSDRSLQGWQKPFKSELLSNEKAIRSVKKSLESDFERLECNPTFIAKSSMVSPKGKTIHIKKSRVIEPRRNAISFEQLFRPSRNCCAESIPSTRIRQDKRSNVSRLLSKVKMPKTSFDFGCKSSLARRSNEISRFGPISVYSFMSSEAAVWIHFTQFQPRIQRFQTL
jgi:hypothetical protein